MAVSKKRRSWSSEPHKMTIRLVVSAAETGFAIRLTTNNSHVVSVKQSLCRDVT